MTKWTAIWAASLLSLGCSEGGTGAPSTPTSEPEGSGGSTAAPNASSEGSAEQSSTTPTPATPTPTTPPSPADDKPRVHFAITVNAGCDIPADTYYYPARAADPVSATSAGVGFADGELGADDRPVTVECNWSNRAPPYSVGINLLAGPVTEQIYMSADLSLDPAASQEGVLLLSGVPVPDSQTYGPAQGDLCTIKVKELDAATGSVWGELSCDTLGPQSGEDSCVIGPSYFAIENCKP